MLHVVQYYAEDRGDRVERVVEIYESVNAISHILKTETKDVGMEIQHAETHTCSEVQDKGQKCIQTEKLGQDKKIRRCYTLIAVCVLLLCIFLLSALIVSGIKFNILYTEKDQLQTIYNNLTTENNHLQTSYKNLTIETTQLQTRYNKLTIERDRLQTKTDLLRKKLLLIDTYTKHGWSYFNLTLYFISTEWKNWENSRINCRVLFPGADLVIIDSNEEHEFILQMLTSNNQAWIGLSDKNNEKVWKWVDSTPLTNSYWNQGQPNNEKNLNNCVIIMGWSKSWKDQPCFYTSGAICEMPVF